MSKRIFNAFGFFNAFSNNYSTKVKHPVSRSQVLGKSLKYPNENRKPRIPSPKLKPLPKPTGRVVRRAKKEVNISNRKLFKQIEPPQEVLKEILALNLAKPRKYKIGRYDTKVAAIGKKKLEQRLSNVEFEKDEHLEFPHLSFFAGAKVATSFPTEKVPEIAFVGRSNVGKSSLINTLADTTVVKTSDKPGLTQQINFFAAGNIFNLIDMPGYGFAYAKEEERLRWKELIETYISTRKTLKRIFIIVDARHGIKLEDKKFLSMLDQKEVEFQIVLTKCDMVISPELARRYTLVKEQLKIYRNVVEKPLMVSAKKNSGILKLRNIILAMVGGLERAREVANRKKAFMFTGVGLPKKPLRGIDGFPRKPLPMRQKGPSYYFDLRKNFKNSGKQMNKRKKLNRNTTLRKYVGM
ncbi:11951_t:CDS:2 [Acaulospora morrowiae]|uniref:11951_t:CDS:1 n=1 Tax=Acaulospora morrowiae TaxID=94023 RepID=A0A9N8W6Q9_9GLOM|nr:11951_t:CDS:2 [Acaulospora morrowiae]